MHTNQTHQGEVEIIILYALAPHHPDIQISGHITLAPQNPRKHSTANGSRKHRSRRKRQNIMPYPLRSHLAHRLQHSRNSDNGSEQAAGRRQERGTGTLITATGILVARGAGSVVIGLRLASRAGVAARGGDCPGAGAGARAGAAMAVDGGLVGEILLGTVLLEAALQSVMALEKGVAQSTRAWVSEHFEKS